MVLTLLDYTTDVSDCWCYWNVFTGLLFANILKHSTKVRNWCFVWKRGELLMQLLSFENSRKRTLPKYPLFQYFYVLNSNILLKVNWPDEKCFKGLPKETSVGWRRSFANQFWILSSFRHNIHFPHYDICFCRMLFRFRFIWSAACTLHVLDIWLVKHMPYKMQFFSSNFGGIVHSHQLQMCILFIYFHKINGLDDCPKSTFKIHCVFSVPTYFCWGQVKILNWSIYALSFLSPSSIPWSCAQWTNIRAGVCDEPLMAEHTLSSVGVCWLLKFVER